MFLPYSMKLLFLIVWLFETGLKAILTKIILDRSYSTPISNWRWMSFYQKHLYLKLETVYLSKEYMSLYTYERAAKPWYFAHTVAHTHLLLFNAHAVQHQVWKTITRGKSVVRDFHVTIPWQVTPQYYSSPVPIYSSSRLVHFSCSVARFVPS